jgi:hypothetical protein
MRYPWYCRIRTTRSKTVAFCRRLELLFRRLIKTRLGAPWGTPNTQLNVVLVVLPSGEEHRGQVEGAISSTCELRGAVIREILDPLGSWTKIELRVLFVLRSHYLRRGAVWVRHGRGQ